MNNKIEDTPLVSIIINNYNYGRFLRDAIDSALNQNYPNTEVIVVDDGSTDDSIEIIANYREKIISILKKNGGQASAINAGFKASQGEIVIFLDADDYLFNNTVERIVAAWKPGLAKVHYRLQIIDVAGNVLGERPGRGTVLDNGDVLPGLLQSGGYITTPTSGNAFSRAVLSQILPIPEDQFRISADGYLITLVPFYGEIAAVEDPLGVYREHGNNLWARSRQIVVAESLQRLVKHDYQKYELLVAKATELGHPQPQKLGFKDYFHLRHRIASLRLDPQNHPIPSDLSFVLAYKGVWSVWLHSKFKWTKKLILSIWFLWVGLLPIFLVKPVISLLLAPQSRLKAKPPILESQIAMQQSKTA